MIEQASLMYGTGTSSHCCESERGAVCSKVIFNDKEAVQMVIAPEYVAYPYKMSIKKRYSYRNLLASSTLESRGNVVFLLANNVPCLGTALICGG